MSDKLWSLEDMAAEIANEGVEELITWGLKPEHIEDPAMRIAWKHAIQAYEVFEEEVKIVTSIFHKNGVSLY